MAVFGLMVMAFSNLFLRRIFQNRQTKQRHLSLNLSALEVLVLVVESERNFLELLLVRSSQSVGHNSNALRKNRVIQVPDNKYGEE